MGAIFISYRRDDASHFVQLLYRRLRAYYRVEDIFLDVDAIPYASQFPQVLEQALNGTDIMLIIIGPKWLSLKGHQEKPRIFDESDFVRLEIEKAINAGKLVLPILIGSDAQMPFPAQLPESIAIFPQLQAIRLSDQLTAQDIRRLIRIISRHSTAVRLNYNPSQTKRLPNFLRKKPHPQLATFLWYSLLLEVGLSIIFGVNFGISVITSTYDFSSVEFGISLVLYFTPGIILATISFALSLLLIFGNLRNGNRTKLFLLFLIYDVSAAYFSIFVPFLLILPLFIYITSQDDLTPLEIQGIEGYLKHEDRSNIARVQVSSDGETMI